MADDVEKQFDAIIDNILLEEKIKQLTQTLDLQHETNKRLLFELVDAQAEAADLRREMHFYKSNVHPCLHLTKQDANLNEQE